MSLGAHIRPPTPNRKASPRPITVLVLALAATAGAAACSTPRARTVALADRSGRALPATVVRVVDGDTLDVDVTGGGRERIRLLGIDTPETVKPNTPVQCYGPEASHRTKALLAPGTAVLLQRDREARDRYGRLLAYLWRAADGLFVNRALVADGFARTLSIAPNTAYRALLADVEAAAHRRGAGLWGACPPSG